MAKNEPFTIDKSYYEGRVFDPVTTPELEIVAGHPMPVQTAIGANGVCCLKFTATDGVSVSTAPYPTPANVAQQRMISISANPADFSTGAKLSGSIQGASGISGTAALVAVPMVKGQTYYVNVANAKRDATGGEMRVQVSLW